MAGIEIPIEPRKRFNWVIQAETPLDRPLPPAYPSLEALDAAGWLPVPRERLPFPSLVAASRNDALGEFDAVCQLARDWGSAIEDLGEVGHLNPAAGFGPWPLAQTLIQRLMP